LLRISAIKPIFMVPQISAGLADQIQSFPGIRQFRKASDA